MATAKYDFETMRTLGNKVVEEATELSNLISTVNGVVAEMTGAWSDPAQTKFESQWNEMSQKLKAYVPIIEEYGKAVKTHADKVEQAGAGI